jgi:hypothetical protein
MIDLFASMPIFGIAGAALVALPVAVLAEPAQEFIQSLRAAAPAESSNV